MRVDDDGTYEMLWDCPRCGTDKLLGVSHRHCPACGAPQDPTQRYYPSEEDKVAVENHVYFGADVACPGCDTPNAANATFCVGCGMPLSGAGKEVVGRSDQLEQAGGFVGETVGAAKQEVRDRRDAQVASALGKTAPEKKPMSTGLKIALIAIPIVVVVSTLVYVLAFWKRQTSIEVEGHRWTRTIAIERYDKVTESAWCDSMPRGAKKLSSSKEKRSTKKVKDGEECKKRRKDNKDGTFKQVRECKPKFKEEPVYDNKCKYTIDKWKTVRTEKAEGQSRSPAPAWPAFKLVKEGKCKGCERVGDKSATYEILFVDPKASETHECEVDEATWNATEVGSAWVAEVGVVSTSLDCDSFKPKG
ncbi:MAG: zinc ribbon domain-containing protein [Myxococcota bacterium]